MFAKSVPELRVRLCVAVGQMVTQPNTPGSHTFPATVDSPDDQGEKKGVQDAPDQAHQFASRAGA